METLSNTTLTKADFSDIPFLWYLHNQPESREWSKHTEKISWDEHINWIMPILMGIENRHIFIIKCHELPVGQLRLDVQGGSEAVISIAVAKEHWGKGLASRALALAQDKARELAINRIIAHIHKQNTASRHLFEKMNFILEKEDGVWQEYRFTVKEN